MKKLVSILMAAAMTTTMLAGCSGGGLIKRRLHLQREENQQLPLPPELQQN